VFLAMPNIIVANESSAGGAICMDDVPKLLKFKINLVHSRSTTSLNNDLRVLLQSHLGLEQVTPYFCQRVLYY
jgi:hypothetical protein